MSRLSRTIPLGAIITFVGFCALAFTPVAALGQSTVSPKGGTAIAEPQTTGNQVTFLVDNSKGDFGESLSFFCSVTGAVTSCEASPTWAYLPAGEFVQVVVTYSTGAPGTGTVSLEAWGEFDTDEGWYDVTVGSSEPPVVRPDGDSLFVAESSTGNNADFWVRNAGTLSEIFSLTCEVTGTLQCESVVPDSVALAPGDSAAVTISFSTGVPDPDTARVQLRATAAEADTGFYHVILAPTSGNLIVNVTGPNSGNTIARGLCLSIAAGAGAAYECGDLRIIHALPTTRTLNKARTPVLLYTSQHAHPYPLLAVWVTLPVNVEPPDTVFATLKIGGVEVAHGAWPTLGWQPGKTYRLVLGYDALDDPTGFYSYTLEVARWYEGEPPPTPVTRTGEMAVVNRKDSPFGAGWWLAGLEKLTFLAGDTLMWIGGDGSVRKYSPVETDVWSASSIAHPDTMRLVGSDYVRILPHGVRVKFNSAGQHVATLNRLGHETRFVYDVGTGRLDSIELAPATAGLTYDFAYDANGRLQSVTAPPIGTASRVTQVFVTGGRIDSIRDPGNRTVSFGYDPGFANWITSRTDRRGFTTSYDFDDGHKLNQSHLDMGGGQPPITTVSRALESFGLPGIVVDTGSAYTLLDGPRTDVGDTTAFWVDRFGAPKKIRDALAHATDLAREDSRFPALVTRIRYPNDRVVAATYDARANVETVTDSSGSQEGQYSTTRYAWDANWDFVTKIVHPEGDSVVMAYSATNGNRLWQQDGRGSSSRVNFNYDNAFDLLSSVVVPGGARDSFTYTTDLGNLESARTPRGFTTTYLQDAIGRDTVVLSPIDTLGTYRLKQRTVYDVMDRVDTTQTTGPAMNGVAEQTVNVENEYDEEGNLKKITRWSDPDTAGIGSIITRWNYDAAGRAVKEIAPDSQADSTVYDPAGNPIEVMTRRGHSITMEYDALNRLIRRQVPSVSYAQRVEGIPERNLLLEDGNPPYPYHPNDASGGYTIAADTAVFDYDEMGNLILADNSDARIRRSYYPNGLLHTDTLRIRTVYGESFSTHVYGLEFEYDLNGRRDTLRHPGNIAPVVSGVVRDVTGYLYDPLTGALEAVIDPLGNELRYHYNLRAEVDTLYLPDGTGIRESYSYDLAGTLTGHRVPNASTSAYKHNQPYLRLASFRSDARGKLLETANTYGTRDTVTAEYSGLGHLINGAVTSHGWSIFPTGPAWTRIAEGVVHDGLANLTSRVDTTEFITNGVWQRNITGQGYGYVPGTGRLAWAENVHQRDTLYYDASGNTEFTTQAWYALNSGADMRDRVSYYGADGSLRATDFRLVTDPGVVLGSPYYATFEEYRYDALGRRVLVRARRWCENDDFAAMCRLDKVRRIVWDGDRELYEIQMPGDSGSTYLENDNQQVVLPSTTEGGSYRVDPNPYYGRVAYSHGLALDAPASIVRMGYGDLIDENNVEQDHRALPPFAIFPIWQPERGQPQVGVFEDGGLRKCETSGTVTRCVYIAWPEMQFAYQRSNLRRTFWHGTLIEDKQDESGTFFRRNRYYDPQTGRFTQEDPIGLAGGLNLYGFAAGDPVNFTDPFGLCIEGNWECELVVSILRSLGGEEFNWAADVYDKFQGTVHFAPYVLRSAPDRDLYPDGGRYAGQREPPQVWLAWGEGDVNLQVGTRLLSAHHEAMHMPSPGLGLKGEGHDEMFERTLRAYEELPEAWRKLVTPYFREKWRLPDRR